MNVIKAALSAFVEKIKNEPVYAIDVIKGVLLLAAAFGLALTPDQSVAIIGLVTIILGVGATAQRALVTPTRKLNQ